ncbi:MAG: efflux RND transporter periplasmic adaptor subunit, partial [Phycisphaerae bacterium]|nr:efflux RND transporter periplasmic adaptor subunit [Phycisphaerae bacterium]
MAVKNQTKPVIEQGMEKSPSRLKQLLIVVSILAFFGLLTFILIKSRKPPQRKEQEIIVPLVMVKQLKAKDIQMVIRAYGTISPKVEVDIVPEVPGKVISVNSDLKAGGLIPAGEQLLQIDERDYKFAVQQADAVVADAQVKLEIEMAEAEVARRSWGEMHPGTEPNSPLVLRESQVRQAKAALESAKAQLATAQLRLERTSLSLPFDALIISEKVDLGQYMVAGQPVAVAYGIDTVEIEIPLEDEELAWFDIFDNSASLNGNRALSRKTPAVVKADFAGAEHTWKGYVTRTTGQVDKMSRMISVVVEVPKPFERSNGRPPLLPGIFAEVQIEGKILKNAIAVPRDAIHDGNKVWVVKGDSLSIQSLDIVRADKDFAYAMASVDQDATIVTSSLDTVMEGMKVR